VFDTQHIRAPCLYVFSGAGLSVESGLSTFRTGDGIWTKANVDKVCNFTTWRRNRDAVFRFYNERIAEKRNTRPNEAHQILAQWQKTWGTDRVWLITQNIDDFLEQAGAQEVVHLHGDMHSLQCTSCDFRFPREGDEFRPDAACPKCGEVDSVKPGIVFFNESAPKYLNLHRMQVEMKENDLFVAIGSSFEVISPEAMLPWSRLGRHERNFLIDPAPRCTEYFGVVERESATIGLHNLASAVTRMMATG
jgi:NAD-dependent deacetylase